MTPEARFEECQKFIQPAMASYSIHPSMADEIKQAALIGLWRACQTHQPGPTVRSYINQGIKNHIYQVLTRWTREGKTTNRDVEAGEDENSKPHAEACYAAFHDEEEAKLHDDEVRKMGSIFDIAREELKPADYRAVQLYFQAGLTQTEQARQLGCTRAAVSLHFIKGMTALRMALRRRGISCMDDVLLGKLDTPKPKT